MFMNDEDNFVAMLKVTGCKLVSHLTCKYLNLILNTKERKIPTFFSVLQKQLSVKVSLKGKSISEVIYSKKKTKKYSYS